MYQSVELYSKPEEGITNLQYSEMTSFQHAFLCGLIKENRPNKIVEVGVSAGGTTGVVLQCLKMLNIKATMYSVDLSERWYRNESYETGFAVKEMGKDWGGGTQRCCKSISRRGSGSISLRYRSFRQAVTEPLGALFNFPF